MARQTGQASSLAPGVRRSRRAVVLLLAGVCVLLAVLSARLILSSEIQAPPSGPQESVGSAASSVSLGVVVAVASPYRGPLFLLVGLVVLGGLLGGIQYFVTARRKPAGSTADGRLAANPRVRRWLTGKPKLAVDAAELSDSPEPAAKPVGVVVRLTLLVVAIVGLLFTVCWLVLGLTVAPTVRAGGDSWLVQRGAWTQGDAPPGERVLVLPEPVERGFLARIRLLAPTGGDKFVATVIAKPSSAMSVRRGRLVVDGVRTGVPVQRKPVLPADSYLLRCESGSCAGRLMTAPAGNVLGSARGPLPLLVARGF